MKSTKKLCAYCKYDHPTLENYVERDGKILCIRGLHKPYIQKGKTIKYPPMLMICERYVSVYDVIIKALKENGETWYDIVDTNLTLEEMETLYIRRVQIYDEITDMYRIEPNIMAWTENFIYITCLYDGNTWLSPVPRNPQKGGVDNYGSE